MNARLCLALVAATFACTPESSKPADPKAAQAQPASEDSPKLAAPSAPAPKPKPEARLQSWSFDVAGIHGTNPTGFKALETNSKGRLAKWGITHDKAAPSGRQAFGVLETTNEGQTYNLALAPEFTATDVELTVSIKAGTGKIDQGGGVVFRAQGATDYYIARWNPLENNVRFYKVVSEVRNALGVAEIELDTAQWQTMRIIVEGPRMEMFMNDESVLVVDDETHQGAGQIGLWTKADAATLFDDLTAQEL